MTPWKLAWNGLACGGYAGAAGVLASGLLPAPTGAALGVAAALGAAAALHALTLRRDLRARRALAGEDSGAPTIIAPESIPHRPDSLFLGYGYPWTPACLQTLIDALRYHRAPDYPEAIRYVDSLNRPRPCYLSYADHQERALTLGGSGLGKSVFLGNKAIEYIMRKPASAVIVFDPKPDPLLLEQVARATAASRGADRFRFFSLAYPSESVCYNFLERWAEVWEVADRLLAMMPGSEAGEVFRQNARMYVQSVVVPMQAMGIPINVKTIYEYNSTGKADLMVKYLSHLYPHIHPAWREVAFPPDGGGRSFNENPGTRVDRFYRTLRDQGAIQANHFAEALIDMVAQSRTHVEKFSANLMPILLKLHQGSVGRLLCPDPDDVRLNWKEVEEQGLVVYFHLPGMDLPDTVRAVMKAALVDLSGYIASKYSWAPDKCLPDATQETVIFVDEFGDAVMDPLIDALDKGRGAKFTIDLAAQTLAKIARKMSREVPDEVTTNCVAWFQFGVRNRSDGQLFSDACGSFQIKERTTSAGYEPGILNSGKSHVDDFSAHHSQSLSYREVPAVPLGLLLKLPRFRYFARVRGRLMLIHLPIVSVPPDGPGYLGAVRARILQEPLIV